jgi:hypothetical protein
MIPMHHNAPRREKNPSVLGLFNDRRLNRVDHRPTRLTGKAAGLLEPDVVNKLLYTSLADFNPKHFPDLITQRGRCHSRITLQFSRNALDYLICDLSLSSFAAIYQNHPMASTFNVPTPQPRHMLGVIRQPQVLIYDFQRLTLLDSQKQLFPTQGKINLNLRESFLHRLLLLLNRIAGSVSEYGQIGNILYFGF